ncbi:hypothetical protein Pmani_015480 [Petrolisthes manimaculis]|uniref:Uncharacterized protein n=1 Tax=Petrolisthes manimaculis TaxID=1843537 RepID=A0AAE1PRI0_9EUCA|nr:hypothetical protein Pmani_015480 [Petrolisthes manimaculis]
MDGSVERYWWEGSREEMDELGLVGERREREESGDGVGWDGEGSEEMDGCGEREGRGGERRGGLHFQLSVGGSLGGHVSLRFSDWRQVEGRGRGGMEEGGKTRRREEMQGKEDEERQGKEDEERRERERRGEDGKEG